MQLSPELASVVATVLTSPVASGLAKLAEKAPGPYEGKTKTGIVLALSLAAFLVRVGLAWATGDLASVDWQEGASLVVQAFLAAFTAAGAYAIARMKPKT